MRGNLDLAQTCKPSQDIQERFSGKKKCSSFPSEAKYVRDGSGGEVEFPHRLQRREIPHAASPAQVAAAQIVLARVATAQVALRQLRSLIMPFAVGHTRRGEVIPGRHTRCSWLVIRGQSHVGGKKRGKSLIGIVC